MALTPGSWRVFRRRFFTACVATLVVMVTAIVVVNYKINDTLAGTRKIILTLFPTGAAEGGNYLIIGSDSRAFVDTPGEAQAFGSAKDLGGQRADVMMVLHIDPSQKTSYLVSFPRDLLVNFPGQGTRQMNSAFDDGPQKVIDVLNQDFDIRINHYVQVNFKAFVSVVDAVGKIPVSFAYPARDIKSGLNVGLAGCAPLDGQSALAYVRSRYLEYNTAPGHWSDGSPRGDLDRIPRQQDFIRKLAAKASAKAGESPFAAIDIANAVVPRLTVDANLSRDDILRLVKTFRNVDPSQPGALEMVTLPTDASTSQPGRLVVNQAKADPVLAQLRTSGAAPTTTSTTATKSKSKGSKTVPTTKAAAGPSC